MSTFAEQAARVKKPRPKLLDKRDKAAKVKAEDDKQKARVRARSGGQCEVWEVRFRSLEERDDYFRRCVRRSMPGTHHLIGGSGRRNKGRSILAEHRLDVCDKCHDEITNHVLVPVDGTQREDAATVRYERVR